MRKSRQPAIQSPLDNLSQQREYVKDLGIGNTAVEDLLQANISLLVASDSLFQSPSCKDVNAQSVPHKILTRVGDGPRFPTSFDNACSNTDWAKAIGKKSIALSSNAKPGHT